MNRRTFDALELESFLQLASGYVQTALGRRRIRMLEPSVSRTVVLQELEITSECVSFIALNGKFGLAGIEDPDPVLEHLQVEGTTLEPKQILAVEKILSRSLQIKSLVRQSEPENEYPHLRRIALEIPDTRHLLSAIGGKILPNGDIDDNASAELRLIRKELTERRYRIHRALESIIRSQGQAVQEEIITFRNERFVIPVRTDSRGQIPGVVHGLSSSGQTTYVEPLSVINQNNDLVRLHEQEATEVAVILQGISDRLRNNIEDIRTTIKILTVLDVSQAKALLASEYRCVQPVISDGHIYEIREARNILLEHTLRKSGSKTVPISLKLGGKEHALVISGPNAGGKTVTLKTLGLVSLMAQMGFLVPAGEAYLPIFNQIFADIGDQQSMAANLSTFTAHMKNIAEMDGNIHPPSLVLLDEIGTGTDPDEGAALAIALLDHFRSMGATIVASTHYPRLKMWASQTDGVLNASVEFDEKSLQPTYRLILGTAGSSSGIEIARRMNIRQQILSKARSLVDPGYAQVRTYLRQLKETLEEQENTRAALEKERNAFEEKYAALEKDFEARSLKQRKEFESKLEHSLRDFKQESERSIRKIKDRVQAARLKKAVTGETAALRRKSIRLVEETFPDNNKSVPSTEEVDGNIMQGDRVWIVTLDREGTVESITDDTVIVAIGAIHYRATLSDVRKRSSSKHSADSHPAQKEQSIDNYDQDPELELKVIGMNADDALAEVDKFLDRCFLSGVDKVRIIHGHGKGILRQAIAEMLSTHLQVESFKLAPPEQGGSGATIVELKK